MSGRGRWRRRGGWRGRGEAVESHVGRLPLLATIPPFVSGQPCFGHEALGDQVLHAAKVARAPVAPGTARREAEHVALLVHGPFQAVDPAEAEGGGPRTRARSRWAVQFPSCRSPPTAPPPCRGSPRTRRAGRRPWRRSEDGRRRRGWVDCSPGRQHQALGRDRFHPFARIENREEAVVGPQLERGCRRMANRGRRTDRGCSRPPRGPSPPCPR